MKCPICEGKLTLIASYDIDLLLICEHKLKKKVTCSYAVPVWDIKGLQDLINNFLGELPELTKPEEKKMSKDNKLINIKDRRPCIGYRCHVYDEGYQQWMYAYWEADSKVIYDDSDRCYYGIFKDVKRKYWDENIGRNVIVIWWLPEPSKPGENKNEN